MTVWEWVILMTVFAIVSTIEVTFISVIIGRIIEWKIELKSKIELELFEKEITKITELIDSYMDKVMNMIRKDEEETDIRSLKLKIDLLGKRVSDLEEKDLEN